MPSHYNQSSYSVALHRTLQSSRSPIVHNAIINRAGVNLDALAEGDLFMELIRDISNELDIDVLCHKILVNVELLTRAERGSLFLVKGVEPKRHLEAKLFDITKETGK